MGKSDVLLPVERVGNRSVLPIGASLQSVYVGFLKLKRRKTSSAAVTLNIIEKDLDLELFRSEDTKQMN